MAAYGHGANYALDKWRGCADESEHCSYWARTGECEKNSGYMHSACRKSCKLCDPAETASQENNQDSSVAAA